MTRSGGRARPHPSKLVGKRRELKVKHDWKMLIILFMIGVIGCLVGAYVGMNYPD